MAQVGVQNKRVIQFLILFVAFYVFTNPDTAGVQARLFFDWVFDLAGSVKTFFDAMLDGDATITTTTTLNP